MQDLALVYLQRALEEAIRAGGNALLDDLFSKLTDRQLDALVGLLGAVKRRRETQQQARAGQ